MMTMDAESGGEGEWLYLSSLSSHHGNVCKYETNGISNDGNDRISCIHSDALMAEIVKSHQERDEETRKRDITLLCRGNNYDGDGDGDGTCQSNGCSETYKSYHAVATEQV